MVRKTGNAVMDTKSGPREARVAGANLPALG